MFTVQEGKIVYIAKSALKRPYCKRVRNLQHELQTERVYNKEVSFTCVFRSLVFLRPQLKSTQ